jgi:hypothetical protein
MANITNKKNIFFVTSPRTPFKMVDEIKLFIEHFEGQEWNKKTQAAYAKKLSDADFFEGKIENNLDFAARDRINRSPKALGFVDLSPTIRLTKAGKQFLYGKRPQEIFLRQLLKFQLSSPYHVDKNGEFSVKPYLELLRMTYELNGLSKDEIAVFVMQLVDCRNFEAIRDKIIHFRKTIKNIDRRQTSYRREIKRIFEEELVNIYKTEISDGNIETRQSVDNSLRKFIETKSSNFRDYADAAIRYLRATELLTFEYKTNRLMVSKYKEDEVKYILANIEREAKEFTSLEKFKDYLFSDELPLLLSDNKADLILEIQKLGAPQEEINTISLLGIEKIKDSRDLLLEKTKAENLSQQIQTLQSYEEYADIVNIFDDISEGNVVDPALVFEWNTWRAFAMLDDGHISGNFRLDLQGMPLFNAPGNKPDIECKYGNFNIIVEVTLSSGQKQYEMEGEPVPRHLSLHQKENGVETYCIFVTKKLSPATLAHFYALHKIDIAYYGGKAKIIPLEVGDFKKLLEKAFLARVKPKSSDLYNFVSSATRLVESVQNEAEWYAGISSLTESWFTPTSLAS